MLQDSTLTVAFYTSFIFGGIGSIIFPALAVAHASKLHERRPASWYGLLASLAGVALSIGGSWALFSRLAFAASAHPDEALRAYKSTQSLETALVLVVVLVFFVALVCGKAPRDAQPTVQTSPACC